jgi:hypothetical protein
MDTFWLAIHKWYPANGFTGIEHHVLWQLDQPDLSQAQGMFEKYMPGDTIELYGPFEKGRVKERIKK